MQPDPSGSVAESTAQDTATDASAAPESGSTAEASSVAEGQRGEETTDSETPTPESDEDTAEDDGDDEGSEATGEQTEEQKRLSRRERQRQREQERIERERQEAVEAYKRTQAEQAEREQRAAEAEKVAKARQERLRSYIGQPGEIEDLHRQIRAEIANPQGADLEALTAKVEQLTAANQIAAELEGFIWDEILIPDLGRGIEIPELAADPEARAVFQKSRNAHDAQLIIAEAVRKAERAKAAAEIEALKKTHASARATLESELRTWRVRAGAEEVPDTTSGGQAAISDGGVLTPERYAAMSFEDRQKLRSTPEGRAQIDAMSRGRTGFGQRSA